MDQGQSGKWVEVVRTMCNRHFGIGADGLILVQQSSAADLKMRIFNADGSEAEACGNGLRCFTKYVIERNFVEKTSLSKRAIRNNNQTDSICISIETLAGIREAKAYLTGEEVDVVEVGMGVPEFKATQIPISTIQNVLISEYKPQIEDKISASLLNSTLTIGEEELKIWILSMGNPHAVTFISQPVLNFSLEKFGPEIENNSLFPKRTNFEVVRILGRKKIEARVWERGVGETLACGSGACAIAVASRILGYTEEDVDIILKGGTLNIKWDGIGGVKLTGPTKEVFIGKYTI
jgi:diaminopimelate epimerase